LFSDIYTDNEKAKLRKLGIKNLFDVFLHLPSRYQDRTKINFIKDLSIENYYQVEGKIIFTNVSYRPRKSLIIVIEDITGLFS